MAEAIRKERMTKVPGLRQHPKHPGLWQIDYRDRDGRRRRENAPTFAAALALLNHRKHQVQMGEDIAPRNKRVWTFERLAREAIKSKALRLAPLTIATDEVRLGQLLRIIGRMRYDHLSPERIDEVLATLRRAGLSSSTCNRYRSFLSSVFTFAVNTNRIAANPVAKVKRFKENEPRVRWLTDDEEKQLRAALMDEPEHELELDLALHTGMRRGEQWGLRWQDVDMERGILSVRGKAGPRKVRANSKAKAALEKLRSISGEMEYVIPDANRRKSQRDWRRWFEAALKRAGIRNFHWHDLRHTFASRLVMNGRDISAVRELMGHKSIVMTQRYAHLSAKHLDRAAEGTGPVGRR